MRVPAYVLTQPHYLSLSPESHSSLVQPQVLTKYKLAGEMSNRVLKAVRSECVAGKRTIDICKLGDELILKETGSVYNKQKEPIKKGESILFSRPLPPCAVCYAACACACEL